jgi:lipopolysaccharide heptosyltransferase II
MARWRKILKDRIRRLRDFLEAFLFRFICSCLGLWSGSARQREIARNGLRALRMAWWPLFALERYRDLWRYLLLIEGFVKGNEPKHPAKLQKVDDWRRVLVIKLGHFGDTLQTIPLLRAMKQSRPGCRIDMLIGPWTVDLVQRIPYVDNIQVYVPHFHYLHRGDVSRCLGFRDEMKWAQALRNEKYDLAIVSYTTGLVELSILSAIRPSCWLGPSPECALYVDIGAQCEAPFQKEIYEADRLLQLCGYLGIPSTDSRLEFPIRTEEESKARELLKRSGISPADAWVVICPGAGWPGKQWPAERFAAVADLLIEETHAHVLICGSRAEEALCRSVAEGMRHQAVNLAGQTGWGELAALIRDARLFIGNDSGPMHLAAVFETPCVVLFGPTPELQWAPRHRSARVIRHVESCPDCWYWHPKCNCAHDRACMKKISVAEVRAASMALLETSLSTQRS